MASRIQLRYGLGDPSTNLLLSEFAFDTSNNFIYIGKGIGEYSKKFYNADYVDTNFSKDGSSSAYDAIQDVSIATNTLGILNVDTSINTIYTDFSVIDGGTY